MKRKQTTTKKVLTWRCSREEYMYSSPPNGLWRRYEARMLPTANSEQQSTPRSRVYAMSVLRLLSACYYNVVSRMTQGGKHPKQNIGEKQKKWLAAPLQKSHIWGEEGLQGEEKVAFRSSAVAGRPQVSYGRDIGRYYRCWLGGQLLFFVGDFSLLC